MVATTTMKSSVTSTLLLIGKLVVLIYFSYEVSGAPLGGRVVVGTCPPTPTTWFWVVYTQGLPTRPGPGRRDTVDESLSHESFLSRFNVSVSSYSNLVFNFLRAHRHSLLPLYFELVHSDRLHR